MREPLNSIELYQKLKPLRKKMKQFVKTDSASLTADEVALMQDVYDDVNVLARQNMPQKLNVSCSTCIREAFHVFISLFDRLEADPDVNPDGLPSDDEEYADRFNKLSAAGFIRNNDTEFIRNGAVVPVQHFKDMSDSEFEDFLKHVVDIHARTEARINELTGLGFAPNIATFDGDTEPFNSYSKGSLHVPLKDIINMTDEEYSHNLNALKSTYGEGIDNQPKPEETTKLALDNAEIERTDASPQPNSENNTEESKVEEGTPGISATEAATGTTISKGNDAETVATKEDKTIPGLALNTEASKTPNQKEGEKKAVANAKAAAKKGGNETK